MKTYNDVLKRIMAEGVDREGRNGFTRALFAIQMRFKMSDGFPAVTTKKLAFNAMKAELLWFIEGSGDDNRLKEVTGTSRTIWTDNAEADYWKPKAKFDGDLGRIYGVQWRSWQAPGGNKVDQLKTVIDKIKNTPNDRRLVVTAWNPGELDAMALPPCHMLFQFFLASGKLSVHMVQRSCDMFLGVPFNIASYSLLLHLVAQVTGTVADECVITFNDAHIYHEHFDAVKEQLSREPLPLPQLRLNPAIQDIDAFTMEDIRLENYESHPPIKAKMIV
jgi:thymidylate synthase